MLEHGGRLVAASRHYGIPLADWLDLSTGIAPWPYPVPEIPAAIWRRLPEEDDGLVEAARACYGAAHVLPLNGSQAAILALPHLRAAGTVAIASPTYGEYAPAWRAAGHRVVECEADDVLQLRLQHDAEVLLLANPNNPDGRRYVREELLAMSQRLMQRGGWLIVDEAFADAENAHSVAHLAGTEVAGNLVVLRSLGKFFGLAGARVGFCIAAPEILVRLQETLGPWPLAHPARFVAKVGLGDTAWQSAQREKCRAGSARLAALLTAHGLAPGGGTALFQYVPCAEAHAVQDFLARRAILVRALTAPPALRFGLPGTEDEWARLGQALLEYEQCELKTLIRSHGEGDVARPLPSSL